jgi:hypothetical protein
MIGFIDFRVTPFPLALSIYEPPKRPDQKHHKPLQKGTKTDRTDCFVPSRARNGNNLAPIFIHFCFVVWSRSFWLSGSKLERKVTIMNNAKQLKFIFFVSAHELFVMNQFNKIGGRS